MRGFFPFGFLSFEPDKPFQKYSDTLVLSNGIAIEVRPASFRGLRGITCVAAIADEAAFWYSDEASANTDTEILSAVRPALATTNGLLAIISSPYARRGEVWNLFNRHYGPGGDPEILVAKGATRDFNPSLPQRTVDRALERDPIVAASEWMGEFRSDIQNLFAIEPVEAAVDLGCFERPRLSGQRYVAFVDAAGGSGGGDSMTMAIAHAERDIAVLDVVREVKPPFVPSSVCTEFSEVMKAYGISRAEADKWGSEFVRERFKDNGITVEPCEKPSQRSTPNFCRRCRPANSA